jgi:DNA-binding transcriptional MerR regulator
MNTLNKIPPLLTAKQVAQILQVTPRTLLKYQQQGWLQPVDSKTPIKRYRRKDLESHFGIDL